MLQQFRRVGDFHPELLLLSVRKPLLHQLANEVGRSITDPSQYSAHHQQRRLQTLIEAFLARVDPLDSVDEATLLIELLKLCDVLLVHHVNAISCTDGQEHAQIKKVVFLELMDRLSNLLFLELAGALGDQITQGGKFVL